MKRLESFKELREELRELGILGILYQVLLVLSKPFYLFYSRFKELELFVLGSKISPSFRKYAVRASITTTLGLIILSFLIGYMVYYKLLSLPLTLGFTALIIASVGVPLATALYISLPIFLYKNRGSTLDAKFPLLMFAVSLLVASGMSLTQVFTELEKYVRRDLKYYDFEVRTVNALVRTGVPLDEALRRVAKITPSPAVRELFVGLSSVARVGGNPASVVDVAFTQYFDKYAMRVEKTVGSLAVIMEVYMAFALILPTLIGTAAILFMVMPVPGMNLETLLFLSIFVLVPVISLAVVVIVDLMVSKLRV